MLWNMWQRDAGDSESYWKTLLIEKHWSGLFFVNKDAKKEKFYILKEFSNNWWGLHEYGPTMERSHVCWKTPSSVFQVNKSISEDL